RWWRVVILAAAASLAGCGGSDSQETQRSLSALDADVLAPLEGRPVAPHETDGAITGQWLDNHQVWLDPTVEHRGKLFVHLPGSNNVPSQSRKLAREAAALGYHVIVLMYPNTFAI